MALPAANMGLSHRTLNFLTVRGNLYAALKETPNGPGYRCVELHKLAGICLKDAWHGTCLA